jgi:hypothetical protein
VARHRFFPLRAILNDLKIARNKLHISVYFVNVNISVQINDYLIVTDRNNARFDRVGYSSIVTNCGRKEYYYRQHDQCGEQFAHQ